MLTRSTITFTGNVQGVGFRMMSIKVARRFHVEGWVRNERDGTVKCVVEGEKLEVDRFITAVQQSMEGFIEKTNIEEAAPTGEFAGLGFAVRH